MPRKTTNAEAVATIGIDIGKNTFHLIGLDRNGAIVLRQKLSRSQVEARLANMPPLQPPFSLATHGGSIHLGHSRRTNAGSGVAECPLYLQ